MTKLEYRFSVRESDLRANIAERLRINCPEMSHEGSSEFAGKAIEKMENEGNGALSHGLTLYGEKIAREIYKSSF